MLLKNPEKPLPPLLTVHNLKVIIKNPQMGLTGGVLNGMNLVLQEGERLALVGESGCGKSITALSILHLLPQPPMEMTEGQIHFKGRDLNGLSEEEWRKIRGKEIGMIFQEPFTSLNPVIAVGKQLAETLKVHLNITHKEIHDKVAALLTEVGLPDPDRIMRQYPHQLSGGMCQRVMIAMAIACGPSLLIADEPTTALDITVQTQVLELLFRMTEKHRLAVLFITHDLRIVRNHADRVAILYLGQVVEEGTPSELFDHPQHPYTEGLLTSLPEFSQKSKELFSIRGVVPSPFEVITGCAFADRCPRVEARCRKERPLLSELIKGHQVRCFYPSKK
jgi:peptide/nickel transport system ATP-binding protein